MDEVQSQLFEYLTTVPMKRKSKYMHGKLKTRKTCIKTNFYCQEVPYDVFAIFKVDSVRKQDKNYHPQVYVEGCKYTDTESQQCKMLSDSEDE